VIVGGAGDESWLAASALSAQAEIANPVKLASNMDLNMAHPTFPNETSEK